MGELKFDFNNMFGYSIGKAHGVTEKDLAGMSAFVKKAHKHLSGLIGSDENRVNLALEWMRLPFQNEETVAKIQELGQKIAENFENVIFLGIGGSYLGLKAAQDALAQSYYNEFSPVRKNKPRIYFEGNNLDPDTLSVLLENLVPEKTFVVVISKSGETTETKAAFLMVEEWLKKALGVTFGRQILAITDPATGTLRKIVNQEQGKDSLSFKNLPLLKGVGGRFSEFNMGLLHLAILGVDIQEVLSGAREMYNSCRKPDLFKNPAYMYAVLHTILYRKKAKSIAVLMPFSETLKSTADWYVQLLAESLGKKYFRKITVNKDGLEEWLKDNSRKAFVGRTPVSCRGTNDLHSIQQNNIEGENNKVITFIRVQKFRKELIIPGENDILSQKKFSELMGLAQEATEWALVRENRPSCSITLPNVSPYHWGALLYFFEMATAFEGELLNVNAFDQPGVEGYKNYMYYKLKKPGISKDIADEIKKNPLIKKKKFII